jgi:hypothetical protein
MATRNLTQKFETLRQQARQRRPSSRRGGDPLLGDDAIGSEHAVNIGIDHSLPPDWVDIVDTIQKDVAKTKDNLKLLQQLHADRLKVTFGEDDTDKEQHIDILTKEIT